MISVFRKIRDERSYTVTRASEKPIHDTKWKKGAPRCDKMRYVFIVLFFNARGWWTLRKKSWHANIRSFQNNQSFLKCQLKEKHNLYTLKTNYTIEIFTKYILILLLTEKMRLHITTKKETEASDSSRTTKEESSGMIEIFKSKIHRGQIFETIEVSTEDWARGQAQALPLLLRGAPGFPRQDSTLHQW